MNSSSKGSKEAEELDQVAGNVEDEIGERVAAVRETELLYGSQSLLALYGPLLVHVCGSPHKFKVGRTHRFSFVTTHKRLLEPDPACDRDIVICQIPLCQFTILRPAPPPPVQDPRDLQRPEHP